MDLHRVYYVLSHEPYSYSVAEIDRMPLAMVHIITSTPKEDRGLTMDEARAYAERRAKERRREQGYIWG